MASLFSYFGLPSGYIAEMPKSDNHIRHKMTHFAQKSSSRGLANGDFAHDFSVVE